MQISSYYTSCMLWRELIYSNNDITSFIISHSYDCIEYSIILPILFFEIRFKFKIVRFWSMQSYFYILVCQLQISKSLFMHIYSYILYVIVRLNADIYLDCSNRIVNILPRFSYSLWLSSLDLLQPIQCSTLSVVQQISCFMCIQSKYISDRI